MNKSFQYRCLSLLFLASTTLISCKFESVRWQSGIKANKFTDPGKMYVCLNLPEKQHDAAKSAVLNWDAAIGNWKHLIPVAVSHDESWCNIYVHETYFSHNSNVLALAWASSIGGREIFMKQGRYEIDTQGILQHEIGHALGAQHVDGTLMNPTWDRGAFVCPDVTTVAQIAARHDINLETLSWCVR